MKKNKLEYLCCAQCGEETIGRQWWNQDKGFGICDKHVEKWTNQDTEKYGSLTLNYGHKGHHHSISLEDKLRNKSIFKDDAELLEQILKYTKGNI